MVLLSKVKNWTSESGKYNNPFVLMTTKRKPAQPNKQNEPLAVFPAVSERWINTIMLKKYTPKKWGRRWKQLRGACI